MAKEQRDSKGNKITFIRKNGRVIPIKVKGGGSSGSSFNGKSSKKNGSMKSKKSAAKAAHGKFKSQRKTNKRLSSAGGAVMVGGAVGALLGRSTKFKAISLGIGAIGAATRAFGRSRNRKNFKDVLKKQDLASTDADYERDQKRKM